MDPDTALRTTGLAVAPAASRAEQLAASIQRRISEQALGPGDLIGTLDSLRTGSGLSKPTVSEAVRLLRERGAVHIKPGRGGGIFAAERGPVVRVRNTLLEVEDEPAAVADAIELRDHLELLVDLGAARRCDDTDAADLRRHLASMGGAGDWDGFMTANWALHRRIAAICPNALARAVYVGTLGQLSSGSARSADGVDSARYRRRRLADHDELVEAVVSGDEARVRGAVHRHNQVDATPSTAHATEERHR